MNTLPNFENAIIPDDKIYGYCLNPNHERGKHKARVFKSVFGISEEDGELLKSSIYDKIDKFEVIEVTENNFGKKYTLPMKITIFGKTEEIITAWIIEFETYFPRLTSCYVNI